MDAAAEDVGAAAGGIRLRDVAGQLELLRAVNDGRYHELQVCVAAAQQSRLAWALLRSA